MLNPHPFAIEAISPADEKSAPAETCLSSSTPTCGPAQKRCCFGTYIAVPPTAIPASPGTGHRGIKNPPL